jgi:predicted phage baseplate assembly protein
VLIPAGFQAGASAAAGGGQVIFETERAVAATPATVAAVAVTVEGVVSAVDPALIGFHAFGSVPKPGNALWVGLAVPPGADPPAPSLSLALEAAATAGAPPVTAGGVAPSAAAPAPLVSWAILDGGSLVPARPLRDETGGLSSGGIVEVGVPAPWRPGRPPGSVGLPALWWLRALLEYGNYPSPPVFSAVLVNAVRALASRTIRDEPLVLLPDGRDGLTRMQLSQVPVVPHSVELDVDADPGGDVFGTAAGVTTQWTEVDSLGNYAPEDLVFTVDYATGVVTFGDGVHGARVPAGFRNVRAAQYRTGGGAAGAVAAGAVNALLTSVGFVTAVTNPGPASGGTDTEPDSRAILRGAEELRTGDRAVTPADYGVLAVNAPGALVARAQGVAGLHPDYPGTPIPGVVGVLCVAPDTDTGLPPVPAEDDLRAVTDFLAGQAAPAGVRVVAAAPAFHLVRTEAWLVLDPREDQTDLLRAAGTALDGYLHPLTGGDAGTGWPFGGPLRHIALVRRLLLVPGVLAVPQLVIVLDGVRYPPCADVPIPPNTLPWPDGHQLLPVPGAGT